MGGLFVSPDYCQMGGGEWYLHSNSEYFPSGDDRFVFTERERVIEDELPDYSVYDDDSDDVFQDI